MSNYALLELESDSASSVKFFDTNRCIAATPLYGLAELIL
jgi:hypothetical protein